MSFEIVVNRYLVYFLILCASFTVSAAGDYRAGQTKSAVCAACHGAKGVSVNSEWPSLAGQHASYLAKQLENFKNAQGRNPGVMDAIVAGLSAQDIEDLAAFYARQASPEGTTPQKYLLRGQLLYRGGDFEKHITACIACHGPKGTGNEQAGFPVLSGQQANYTLLQLQQFQGHQRHNDLNSIMQDISSRMDANDMEAVAHYVAGLH